MKILFNYSGSYSKYWKNTITFKLVDILASCKLASYAINGIMKGQITHSQPVQGRNICMFWLGLRVEFLQKKHALDHNALTLSISDRAVSKWKYSVLWCIM